MEDPRVEAAWSAWVDEDDVPRPDAAKAESTWADPRTQAAWAPTPPVDEPPADDPWVVPAWVAQPPAGASRPDEARAQWATEPPSGWAPDPRMEGVWAAEDDEVIEAEVVDGDVVYSDVVDADVVDAEVIDADVVDAEVVQPVDPRPFPRPKNSAWRPVDPSVKLKSTTWAPISSPTVNPPASGPQTGSHPVAPPDVPFDPAATPRSIPVIKPPVDPTATPRSIPVVKPAPATPSAGVGAITNLTIDALSALLSAPRNDPKAPRPTDRDGEVPSFGAALDAALAASGLGSDPVDHVQKLGPAKGRIVGRESADGRRGWRADYDKEKGFHVDWWDRTAGPKRSDWRFGVRRITNGTEADYLRLLQHFPDR